MAPQFENTPGESNASQVTIPAIVSLVLCPLFVGIRFWTRWHLTGNIGADDWTILASLVFSAAVSALMIVSCEYGFGQHIYNIHPENRLMALKLFYIAQLFYKININLTKASFLFLYLRIFVQKPFRIACWIMMGVIVGYLVASSVASIFQCTPIPRAWDKRIDGICINITKNWYANSGFSIATDIILLLMPMPIIYRLSMPATQRIGLMCIFAVGVFIVATSVMRMTTLNFSTTSPDPTYDVASTLWTLVESNVGIVCACLPMFRQPLSHFFPTMFPSSTVAKSKNSGIISSSTAAGFKIGYSFTGNGKYSYGGSGKNEWEGDMGDSDVRLREVVAGGNNDSREYILRGDGRVVKGNSMVVGNSAGRTSDRSGDGIEKTIDYTVHREGRLRNGL